jgi:hypothetical protein
MHLILLLGGALAAEPAGTVHHLGDNSGVVRGIERPGLPKPRDADPVAGFLVVRPQQPARDLRDGDLVFQRSRSAQAPLIAALTGSPYTHVGLVRIRDGEAMVFEAAATVRLTPFDSWAARGQGAEVVVRRAHQEPAIWTPQALARLDALQAAWLGRPYDAQFQPGDRALYCSELVREAYLGAAGVELAPLRPVSSWGPPSPAVQEAMVQRWGRIPVELPVVAPSDLLNAELLRPVLDWP